MRPARSRKLLLPLFALLFALAGTPAVYGALHSVVFGGDGPGAGEYTLGRPLATGYPYIVSAFNQPRDVAAGTNPHRGTDMHAEYGTDVLAVCDGWVIAQDAAAYELTLACDRNGNGIRDDGLLIQYDHLSTVGFVASSKLWIAKGTKIAETGDEGGAYTPHLHFGTKGQRPVTGSGAVWFRNEPYYRGTSWWNYGKDLDFIGEPGWDGRTMTVPVYGMNDGGKAIDIPAGNVIVYHRKEGAAAWIPAAMTKSGAGRESRFAVDFGSVYPQGTVFHFMIRAERPKLDVYDVAFQPPKFASPAVAPRGAAGGRYDYFRCQAGGTCAAVTTR